MHTLRTFLASLLRRVNGQKSYISALALGLYKIGVNLGWWPYDPSLETAIVTMLLFAFRSALKKIEA